MVRGSRCAASRDYSELIGVGFRPSDYAGELSVHSSSGRQRRAGRHHDAELHLNVSVTPLTEQFVLTPPDGVVGQPYTSTPLAVNGGTTPYVWTATGLPAGLAINPTSGTISGTPTVANPGGSTVTIKATDAATPAESVPYSPTIRIGSVIAITPLTLPAGAIGVPYSVQLNASGGIGGLGFGPPSPAQGVLLSSSGLLTIANPQASSITFSISVHDGSQPVFQTVSTNYTILFTGTVGGNVTFTTQPANTVGGQVLGGSPMCGSCC